MSSRQLLFGRNRCSETKLAFIALIQLTSHRHRRQLNFYSNREKPINPKLLCYKMKFICFHLFVLISIVGPSSCASPSSSYCPYDSTQVVRVIPSNREQITLLNNLAKVNAIHIKSWIPPSHPLTPALYSARIETAQFMLEYCKQNGINATIVINDIQRNIVQMPMPETHQPFTLSMQPNEFDLDVYHKWTEIEDFMIKLQKTYKKFNVSIIDIGRTSENRSMKVIKIGPLGRTIDKGIFIDAAIHAREWIATSVATYIMHNLTVGYDLSEDTRHMVNDITWYILPVYNLDGYIYTWETDRLWRKNRSLPPNCTKSSRQSDSTCFCKGVDLNRNWDAGWINNQNGEGYCTHRCCTMYSGPASMSEPETNNVAKFLKSNENRIQAYVSLHNYGQLWLYPYAYSSTKFVRGVSKMHEVGDLAVQALHNVHGSNYTLGSSANALYVFYGASTDWVADNTNITFVYTVEVRPSSGDFCLPKNEIRQTCEEVFAGIKVVASAVMDKVKLTGKFNHYFNMRMRSTAAGIFNFSIPLLCIFVLSCIVISI